MNTSNYTSSRTLNKVMLVAFLLLAVVQMVFNFKHPFIALDFCNGLLTVAGLICCISLVFPNLVENFFFGAFSFLLKINRWVPVVLCALLVASLGWEIFLLPSQNLSNTAETSPLPATPTPSYIFAPTPSSSMTTPTPLPILSSSGTPILNDSMASPVANEQWDVVSQPNVNCNFVNGVYDIKVLPQQIDICKTEAAETNLSNFIYQITMTTVQGSGASGIVFRDNGQDPGLTTDNQRPPLADMIVFDQSGNYTLAVVGQNGQPAMTKSGRCNNFRQGLNQPNQIDIQVKGDTIDVFVNGVYLNSTTDTQLRSGQMGVLLGASNEIAEATYSNLQVWKL